MEANELAIKVRETFEYDVDTGVFVYKVTRGPKTKGSVAGSINSDGYLQVGFNGSRYLLHRLAFLYMKGEWPKNFVDHKDTDKLNNKWCNLRDVLRKVNNRNRSVQKNNTSGVVGVSWDKINSKWFASICVEGKMIGLGRFNYKEDAILARMTAEKDYGYWVDKVWDKL